MIDSTFLDGLAQRIAQILPRANEFGEDARKRVKTLLQKSFDELDLVTQDEFESQVRALQRAEERIAELELLVGELERRLAKDPGSDPGA